MRVTAGQAQRDRVAGLDAGPRRHRGGHEHGSPVAQCEEGIGPVRAADQQGAGILEHVRVDPGDLRLLAVVAGDPNDGKLEHRTGHLDAVRGVEGRAERLGVQRHAGADRVPARQDRGDPELGAGTCRLCDRAECHHRGEGDHHCAHGQPRPRPVPAEVGAPEQPLGAEEPLERAADEPAERLEHEGGRDRAAEQQGQ